MYTGGKTLYLGSFATAEEAALRYARASADKARALALSGSSAALRTTTEEAARSHCQSSTPPNYDKGEKSAADSLPSALQACPRIPPPVHPFAAEPEAPLAVAGLNRANDTGRVPL